MLIWVSQDILLPSPVVDADSSGWSTQGWWWDGVSDNQRVDDVVGVGDARVPPPTNYPNYTDRRYTGRGDESKLFFLLFFVCVFFVCSKEISRISAISLATGLYFANVSRRTGYGARLTLEKSKSPTTLSIESSLPKTLQRS
jgi:hypothetical protein